MAGAKNADWYFLYQKGSSKTKWLEAPAHLREQVLKEEVPLYMTALDTDTIIADDEVLEDPTKVKYRGWIYFDWDGELDQVMAEVNKFLDDLRDDKQIDPSCLDIALTGGRGVHVRIPWQCYCAAPEDNGLPLLPMVYKEMAFNLWTPSLDVTVYSCGKGRMWRTLNVQRENGRYKVPVTADEIRSMTAERYAELTLAPRPVPERSPPKPSIRLSAQFAQAVQTAHARVAKNKKSNRADVELIRKFGGIPPTLRDAFDGKNIDQSRGLNAIAMQLAIAACALGIDTMDRFLEETKGFQAERAKVPGTNHGSAAAVRQELRRIYGYISGNITYVYTNSAFRYILTPEVRAKSFDLDGAQVTEDGELDGEACIDEYLAKLTCGVYENKFGFFKRSEEGVVPMTNLSLNPSEGCDMLFDPDTSELLAVRTHALVSGQPVGSINADFNLFRSPDTVREAANKLGALATGVLTHKDTQALMGAFQMAQKRAKTPKRFAKGVEGLYVVPIRSLEAGADKAQDRQELVWISPMGTISPEDAITDYEYFSQENPNGVMSSNLVAAEEVQNSPYYREAFHAMLNFLHDDFVIAASLGWLVACMIKPILCKTFPQFPLLNLVGEAGSGKTTTLTNLMKLFYAGRLPKIQAADGPTPYAWEQMLVHAASVPIIMDEYKPSTLGPKKAQLDSILHTAYTVGQEKQRGGGGGSLKVRTQRLIGSVCFISETMHESTAVQERSIVVQFSKAIKDGKEPQYRVLCERGDALSSLGKSLAIQLVKTPGEYERITALYQRNRQLCRGLLLQFGNDRIVENIAVVRTGLEYLRYVLHILYDGEFDNRFDVLLDALMSASNHVNLSSLSEAAKALQRLAYLSRLPEGDTNKLVKGRDYLYEEGGLFVDIDLESSFYKLATASRGAGVGLIYTDVQPFKHAMFTFAATRSTRPLTHLEGKAVVRMDVAALARDHIVFKA